MNKQQDLFGVKSTFAAKVEDRIKSNKEGFFRVPDVAEALGVGNKKVRVWIEEGRLPAVNMNFGCKRNATDARGRLVKIDERPMWRMTFDDVLAFARSLDNGI